MIQISIEQVANQSVKFQVGQELYEVTIRTTSKATFFSLKRNNVEFISNEILITNSLLIQSRYQVTNGNFIFYSLSDILPSYKNFGVTQFFYYATLEELQNG